MLPNKHDSLSTSPIRYCYGDCVLHQFGLMPASLTIFPRSISSAYWAANAPSAPGRSSTTMGCPKHGAELVGDDAAKRVAGATRAVNRNESDRPRWITGAALLPVVAYRDGQDALKVEIWSAN